MGARATRLSDLKIKAAKPKDKDPPTLNDKARPVRALSHLGFVQPNQSMPMPMMHIRKMRMTMP